MGFGLIRPFCLESYIETKETGEQLPNFPSGPKESRGVLENLSVLMSLPRFFANCFDAQAPQILYSTWQRKRLQK